MLRTCLLLCLMTAIGAEVSERGTATIHFIIPDGFTGPFYVSHIGRETFDTQALQYSVVISEDGEGTIVGVPTIWQGRRRIVTYRATEYSGADRSDEFMPVTGFGPSRRIYRPEAFSAFFVGSEADREQFSAWLDAADVATDT